MLAHCFFIRSSHQLPSLYSTLFRGVPESDFADGDIAGAKRSIFHTRRWATDRVGAICVCVAITSGAGPTLNTRAQPSLRQELGVVGMSSAASALFIFLLYCLYPGRGRNRSCLVHLQEELAWNLARELQDRLAHPVPLVALIRLHPDQTAHPVSLVPPGSR